MRAEREQEIAYTLEAPPALLPFLPALLADCWALGSFPDVLIDLLRPLDLPQETTRVLDLGCGKGAVSVPLAQQLRFQVLGVDAFEPFVNEARRRAAAHGVADRCSFACDDLRNVLRPADTFDVVVYAGVGDVLGPLDETIRRLRRVVRPDGYLVIDDAFLAEEGSAVAGYDAYAAHAETLRRLASEGDEIVKEVVFSPEVTRAENRRLMAHIRQRATELAQAHPDAAALLQGYVQRQERECELLETVVVPATWLVRRRG